MHRRIYCFLNRVSRRRSKEASKFRVSGLCEGNLPVTGEFPALRASNVENVSICWRHDVNILRSMQQGMSVMRILLVGVLVKDDNHMDLARHGVKLILSAIMRRCYRLSDIIEKLSLQPVASIIKITLVYHFYNENIYELCAFSIDFCCH